MRVVITGGSGLIGRALARELLSAGYEVIALSRNPDKATGLPAGVRAVHWDGRTSVGWGHLADGAEVIVNLAGESIAGDSMAALILKRWTPARKRLILESRLNAAGAVMQAIQEARHKPKVVVQASAVGYYGSRGDEELIETSAPGDDFVARVCRDWEASTTALEQIGVRRVIIRTGGVAISTEGGAFPFMLLPFRLFMGGPLGNGSQWFSWIHLADEARAIRFLIEAPSASGIFNLSAPGSMTNAEFSRILGRVLNRPSFIPVPAIALRLAFGEKAEILLVSQRQFPKRLLELGFNFQYPEAETALRNLLNR